MMQGFLPLAYRASGFFLPRRVRAILAQVLPTPRKTVRRKIQRGEYQLEDVPVCPLCASTSFEPVADRDRHGLPVGVALCHTCGLGLQMPRLTSESLTRFYQADYRRLMHPGVKVGQAQYERGCQRGARIGASLESLGISPEGRRVIEIGAGPGGILGWFHEHGAEVIGCDLDPACVAYAVSRGIPLQHGDVGTLLEADAQADVVILSHLLEHIPQPLEFLARVQCLLQTDGVAYVEVPGIRSPEGAFHRSNQIAHVMHYDLNTLRAMMACAGFTLVGGNEYVQAAFRVGQEVFEVPVGNFEANQKAIQAQGYG